MSEFKRRVKHRLRSESFVWLATAGHNGAPQPNLVWFLWEPSPRGDGTILTYNRADARRLDHIRRNPRVALHFNAGDDGGDIVVLAGEAEILTDAPPASQHSPYLDKYRDRIAQISGTPEGVPDSGAYQRHRD